MNPIKWFPRGRRMLLLGESARWMKFPSSGAQEVPEMGLWRRENGPACSVTWAPRCPSSENAGCWFSFLFSIDRPLPPSTCHCSTDSCPTSIHRRAYRASAELCFLRGLQSPPALSGSSPLMVLWGPLPPSSTVHTVEAAQPPPSVLPALGMTLRSRQVSLHILAPGPCCGFTDAHGN